MNEYFVSGGPMMWPLLSLSIITFVITFEKATRFLLYKAKCKKTLRTEFITLAEREGIEIAVERSEHFSKDIINNILLMNLANPFPINKTEIALQDKLHQLNSFSRVYDFVLYLAPICGILGTVIGVIVSFDIAGDMELMDPSLAMKGIAQAFISTAAGLFIAVMAYIPSSIFDSLLDKETNKLNNFLSAIKNIRQD